MTEPTPCSRWRRPLVPQELGQVDRRPTCLPARPTLAQLVEFRPTSSQVAFWAVNPADWEACRLTEEDLLAAIKAVWEDRGLMP